MRTDKPPTTEEGETNNNEQAVNDCQTRAVPQTAATRTATTGDTSPTGTELDHLADAGGAYLVLPYGLLDQLSAEQQQQIVHIVEDVARTNPRWASDTTYQVLHWVRVHPADLSTEELTWHGISSDIDPATGTVAYSRGGKPMSPETTVGHRPAPDATPAPPGTHPGARPALLPPHPARNSTGMTPATSQGLRTDRAKRVIETRRRREVLFQRAPTADPQWAEAIIAADPLWGPDEDWKLLIDQTTTDADPPTTTTIPPGRQRGANHTPSPY